MRSVMKYFPHAEIGLLVKFRRPLQLVVMMSIMSLASHCLAGDQESLPNWWRSVRDCNTKYHPWTPPATLEEWQALQPALKTQIQLSQGLWPLPERTPLNPVVHGRIEGDDYIIEKVWFESFPGLVVTGNLYRPKTITGKVPAILNPHGHWPNGRFYDAGDGQADAQIKQGAEKDSAAAHSPLQARMVHLARMGCIAFHYDMIGYADQKPIDHRANFITAQDGQWLIENMGLQTWNSIRALDYLCTLPEVDQSRLAVTGSSGGGTQTMLVAALDDRIQVSVPAVMVSTAMQGGCVCENSPYLRIDSNNIAIAAVFAPKPQGLIGANDWTIHLEK
ncbi:MAG: acetylxylan esterase, partial [Planctomycetaceae bacterium]|nr:acetylxylan esterase [Planctomycetaceae bacterium]